ncbi:substrate-binding periplasmic protein [Planctobacterium marinum]|uniref:Solute-binding protein family 3/N-terminal domain-containing protein n=1 Tax=Planctobacterium marinum TaxID=1631968 RepID=A0AA48KQR2_9ALTE|nr:hypothetical protein MACH26_08480 [Planctobacterium marinum]
MSFSVSSTERQLIYPRPEAGIDKRQDFAIDLLQAILTKMPRKYQLQESLFPAQQDRALLLLNDKKLDIVWTGTSDHREKHYRAVRIPIQKGLLGWRLLLVNEDQKNLLRDVHTIEQLKLFSVGLGGGWPDVALFSDNGFVVHTTTSYEALFKMLQKRRFDLFPRSVLEVWSELESYKSMGIAVESNVALHYPYANFYFVHRDDKQLAQDIAQGFNQLIDSGEYERMFQKSYQHILDRAQLSERKILSLKNGFFRKPDDKEKKYYFNL